MKLLIVGSALDGAIEKNYLKYLENANVEVCLLDIYGDFLHYYCKNIANKIFFRLGLSKIYKRINTDLIENVKKIQPTHIWVFKGMEIYPKTLQSFKNQGIKLINYNPDNPFIFSQVGSGNSNVTKSIEIFDLHFTYSLEIKDELEKRITAKVAYLPFGFETSDIFSLVNKPKLEIIKLCFVGNPDKQRAKFLNQLASSGIKIDVYGNKWKNFINHPNFSIHDAVHSELFWKTLCQYRIQLNIMRIHNENSHNMRTFEIPAIGGIQLAPRTIEHETFFLEGKEIFLYDNLEDCVEKIKSILQLSSEDAFKIRKQAQQRCIKSEYSYEDRANQVLESLNFL